MSEGYTSITSCNWAKIGPRKIIYWPVKNQLGRLPEKNDKNSEKRPFGCKETQEINPFMKFENFHLSWE